MGLEVKVKATSPARGKKREKLARRLTQTLRQFAVGQRFRIQGAFKVGGHGNHGGRNWKKLAPATVKAKGHSQILVDTGKLRNSIRFAVVGNGMKQRIQFYSETNYAGYHDSDEPRTKIPRRPIFVITKQDRIKLTELIKRDVRQDLTRLPDVSKTTTKL